LRDEGGNNMLGDWIGGCTFKELEDFLDELNYTVFELTKDYDEDFTVCFNYSSYYFSIVIKDTVLWDNEELERRYIDEDDVYEPLRTCVNRRFLKYLRNYVKIGSVFTKYLIDEGENNEEDMDR
jgi:hypothetical protein